MVRVVVSGYKTSKCGKKWQCSWINSKTLNANISKTKTPEHLSDPSLERGGQNTHFEENFDRGSPLMNKRITRKISPISKNWIQDQSVWVCKSMWRRDVISHWEKILKRSILPAWTWSNMISKKFKIRKHPRWILYLRRHWQKVPHTHATSRC